MGNTCVQIVQKLEIRCLFSSGFTRLQVYWYVIKYAFREKYALNKHICVLHTYSAPYMIFFFFFFIHSHICSYM